jgi:serine/threonine protein kinase
MAADELHDDKTRSFVALAPGTLVLHYRILERIGAGGMGEVYLALDSRLNRKVALKFLSRHLSQDEDHRRRFTREAQAAGSLDHPNIAAIYEVGDYNGCPFFAMQIVEGSSLREVIADKDLSVDRILQVAIHVCEGLHAAHEKGIIHRDIKPSNILIDQNGRVRIVDFGLAAITGSDQLTRTGSTLGTVGYMSPEQVKGQETDRRSDLFSLGVVLYELISKRNPFRRDNEIATSKAISDDTPEPLARFKSGLPVGLQAIIDKALEKDVRLRYQNADGMLSDLLRVKRSADSTSAPVPRDSPSKNKRILLKAGWVIPVLVAVLVLSHWLLTKKSDRANQMSQQNQITFLGDVVRSEISPDASLIAYSRRSEEGETLEVRDLKGGRPVEIFSHVRIHDFRWSPDGSEILIAAQGEEMGLYTVPRLGGQSRFYPWRTFSGTNINWLPDGSGFLVKSPQHPRRIFRFERTSGTESHFDVDGPFDGFRYAECHPDGKRVLIQSWSPDYALWSARMDGSDLRRVYDGYSSGPRWLPDGSAVALLTPNGDLWDLMAIRIDRMSGEVRGQPIQVLAGLDTDGNFSISANGRSVLFARSMSYSNLRRINLDVETAFSITGTDQITSGTQLLGSPDISPDGQWIAFTGQSGGYDQIHVLRSDGTDQRQVTFSDRTTESPCWSPDGSQIAFIARRGGTRVAGIVNLDGSAMRLFDSATCGLHLSWSPGQEILYERLTNSSLGLLDPQSGDVRLLTDDSRGWTFSPIHSRDGSRIAFYWNYRASDDSTGVWVIDSTDSHRLLAQWTRDETALYPLIWSKSDSAIYCWGGDGLWSVNATSGNIEPVLDLPFSSISGISISPQLDFVICNVKEWKGDLWLAEGFSLHVQ